MINTCVICGIPIADNVVACSERCNTEYENRREILRSRIRALRATQRQRMKTKEEIIPPMVRAIAQTLLDLHVPTFASCWDLDRSVCKLEPSLKELKTQYRKSQITRHVDKVYYHQYSRAGRGRITFTLSKDKETVRQKLEQIVSQGMTA